MIKRSELKPGMIVRVCSETNESSFWQRLLTNRYVEISKVAPEPDNALAWSMSSGLVLYYGVNFYKQISNTDIEPVSTEEQERVQYILKHEDEFLDLFKLGRKINRKIDAIENILFDDLGIYTFDLWDCDDANHFKEMVTEALCCEGLIVDSIIIEEAKEEYQELLDMLDKMTELEQKHIRDYAKEN